MKVSIIIPILNEEKNIHRFIERLDKIKGNKEVIFVDGGSEDRTVSLIPDKYQVVKSPRGRGQQMNTGAKYATGDIFLFLHCDSQLEEDALAYILTSDISAHYAGGCFSMAFDGKGFLLRLVAYLSNIRVKVTKIMFGDQGIFVRKEVFEELGGFLHIPIMEDLEFSRRLKKRGKIIQLKGRIVTSSRRFEELGVMKAVLLMQRLKLQYFLGASPDKLQYFYKNVR